MADVDGDGILDLVLTNCASSSVSVFLGNGDGTFRTPVSYATGPDPSSVAVADFNGDGILDLVVVNGWSSSASVLLGKGDGTFQTQLTYATGPDPFAVAVADFNGDGVPDLVIANGNAHSVSVLLATFRRKIHFFQEAYEGDRRKTRRCERRV